MIQIGICDDEKSTCSFIENAVMDYLQKKEMDIETEVWYDGKGFCKDLSKGFHIDILFLDIELPDKNGVDVGKFIRDYMHNSQMQIVYISSKTNYAMELFQNHPFDFIVKPISTDQIMKILDKLLIDYEQNSRIFIYKYKGETYRIPVSKILYLKSNNKAIEVHLEGSEIMIYKGKLQSEATKLPISFSFTSKSYLLNLNHIKEFSYDHITLDNGEVISISQSHRKVFRRYFLEYNSR